MLRFVPAARVTEAVRDLCIEANYILPTDMVVAMRRAVSHEQSDLGRDALLQLLENAEIARTERIPYCQDTGITTVFVRKGSRVVVEGGSLYDAIQEGVRRGYREGLLRKSMVDDPFLRRNTGDNTPAIVHLEESDAPELVIWVVPKGAGSENMSRLVMLTPADGWEGVRREVVETMRIAGPNACPPVILGVGVGGNFEYAPYLAKKALLRDVGTPHPDPRLAALEQELLEAVNRTGIGPQGLGGVVTALAVHLEVHATHIASLPVAINVGCHAYRHRKVVLLGPG